MSKKNEQIGLLEVLDSTCDKYLSSQTEEKDIYRKMNEELEQATQRIKLSYQEKFNTSKNKCRSLKKELENYKKLLENYSTFDSKMIGNIIAQLISLIEGENYSYQEATHETYKYEPTVFGSESFRANKKLLMIIKGNEKQASYHDYNEQNNVVYKLVKNGQAVVLSESEVDYDKKITFYTSNEGSIKSLIDFNNFSYINDFINLVIQYRYEKHLENISEKELLNILSQFILSKKQMIEENYKKRATEKQEKLIQQFIKVQKKMDEERELQEFEAILKNGVPSRYTNNLIDRLQEITNNVNFNNAMRQFEILYEGEKNTATITCSEPLISAENIFISKINIESSIKYFDDSDPDPHFHGNCNISLVDDGLIGIVDISSIKQDLTDFINSFLPYGLYKVNIIDDKYLRILYLPNKGEYRHKPIDIFSWIMEEVLDTTNKKDKNSTDKNTSYKTEWNINEESERMLTYLKEIELVSNLNQKQLKLYRQRKNNN